MKSIYLLTLFSFLSTFSFSQYADCIDAMEIFDKSSITTFIENDSTEIDDMLFLDQCPEIDFSLNGEDLFPSLWMKWTVFESGTLTFDITLDAEIYDFDFIVYKSESSEIDCESLTPIRCMFSGPSVSNGMVVPGPCNKSTGLSFFETDLSESAGCPEGQNGYARYLDVEAGETYVLFILDFSGFEELPVTISFCGTALLGPNDFICEAPLSNEEEEVTKVSIAPNPATEFIRLNNLPLNEKEYSNWTIVNIYGAIHKIESINDSEFVADISHLSQGMYLLMYEENGVPKVIKFFKL